MPILRPIIVALLPFILAIAYSAATCADFGDAQTESLGVQILRGHTTTGSGGHAATPVSLSRLGGALAASSVCAINNTTVATGGSPKTLRSEVFNVAAGYLYEPPTGS